MKHFYSTLSAVLLSASGFFSSTAFAYDFTSEGIYYTILSSTDLTASVAVSPDYNYTGTVNIPSSASDGTSSYSVTAIGSGAFYECPITGVAIPSSITTIGDHAFFNCTSLGSMTVPATVTTLGSAPFGGCTSLTAINVAADNPNYTSIGGVLFNKDATILINFPAGKAGYYTVPGTVATIGDYAFNTCAQLVSVVIPDETSSIGTSAFSSCTALSNVGIGSAVTSIGNYAFFYCGQLSTISCAAPTPPVCGTNCFLGVNTTTSTLSVPVGSRSLYQSTSPWSSFSTIVEEIPTGIEPILAQPPKVSITGTNIHISGIETDALISIYNTSGQLIHRGTDARFSIPSHGIYIMKVGNATFKLRL